MSQEYNPTPTSRKRRARSNRNRPVLVTQTTEQTEQLAPTTDELAEEPELASEPVATTVAEPEAPSRMSRTTSAIRRLPGFFSNVGKREQEEEPQKEVDVVQARLARATRGKASKATAAEEKQQETPKAEPKTETRAAASTSRASTPARPASPFKMRYILGMVIYLFGAQFLLPAEKLLLVSINAETSLAKFNLFGAPADITTSFLLNIVTLIVLLWILVKMDLLPGSLRSLAGVQSQGSSGSRSSSNSSDGGRRTAPPTMRQGVQGEDDDLYREYRANQRREKKR